MLSKCYFRLFIPFFIFNLYTPPLLAAPELMLDGLVDIRAGLTDNTVSWNDYGLGKTRYGGRGDGPHHIFEPAELSILLFSELSDTLTGVIHSQYSPNQEQAIDLVSAFLRYRANTDNNLKISSRIGIFFPPISFEHRGNAWHNVYAITPSAINSWIGEELRTLGGELNLHYTHQQHRFAINYALFFANDPAGSLLAWRGWALHDTKSTLHERLPLGSLQPNPFFADQAPFVEPFHEIDHKAGYYIGLAWRYKSLQTRLLYYDNQAKQTDFNPRDGQYAWHTIFTAAGFRLKLPLQVEVLGQWMRGKTSMGRAPITFDHAVAVDFESAYLLLHKDRFSLRYDYFEVDDLDQTPNNNNNERGYAWTLAYQIQQAQQHYIFEILNINSHRADRELSLNTAVKANEWLLQFSYRWFF